MRISEPFARLILLSISSLVALALAEGALRLAAAVGRSPSLDDALERSRRSPLAAASEQPFSLRGLVRASPYPEVVYELVPGLRGQFQGRPLRTNSHGMRSREVTREKSAGVVRIAGLGDSVMFGWGVGQRETYLEILERRLAAIADGTRHEVLNFAVPGYNTAMQVALFEHVALAFDPDLVVLHFVDNDLRLPHFMMRRRSPWNLDRFYLLELLRSRLGDTEPRPEDLFNPRRDSEARRDAAEQYQHMKGEAGFRRAMARLAELTRTRGIEVIVLRLARNNAWQELVDEVTVQHGFRSLIAGDLFLAELARLGRGTDEDDWGRTFWVSRRDHHPNARGHELYAAALLPMIRHRGTSTAAP